MSEDLPSTDIRDYFSTIEDPRIDRTRRHNLFDILVIALCAMISGAEDFVHIEMFGNAKIEWLQARLELPNGIPSHDTFARVFSLIDPTPLERAFVAWVDALQKHKAQSGGTVKEEVVAIDGKTSRHSFDPARERSAIHMVSAWATSARLVLGQVKVDNKSNEITAIPDLLDLLDITGCLITIDAMGCQKAIASKIIEKGGNYILGLKDNHPSLKEGVELFLEHAAADKYEELLTTEYFSGAEKDHGRIETRHYRLVQLPEGIAWEAERKAWAGLQSIGVVTATRQIDGKTSTESRLFLTSINAADPKSAQRFAHGVRSHWGIENSLHWVLDVQLNEDDCRVRKSHAPENLAVMRHILLNLLRSDTTTKKSLKGKRLLATWEIKYVEHLLSI
jgi:predicted transposase YbfD/YdcC